MQLTDAQIQQYNDDGFIIVRGVFDGATVQQMREHYMKMRAEGPKPSDMGGDPNNPDDPLNKYPRLIQMHNWDEQSGAWANDSKILDILRQLFDGEPVLNQTMLYFKPPGARGQAHHQDQQYITLDPLIGVWVALDPSDEGTGQMMLVPGSHKWGLQPVEEADTSASFTAGKTVLPEGVSEVGADMQPGDVLFFAGKTIHGSYPNTTTDRWRRSFICHYVAEYSVPFVPGEGQNMAHLGKHLHNLK